MSMVTSQHGLTAEIHSDDSPTGDRKLSDMAYALTEINAKLIHCPGSLTKEDRIFYKQATKLFDEHGSRRAKQETRDFRLYFANLLTEIYDDFKGNKISLQVRSRLIDELIAKSQLWFDMIIKSDARAVLHSLPNSAEDPEDSDLDHTGAKSCAYNRASNLVGKTSRASLFAFDREKKRAQFLKPSELEFMTINLIRQLASKPFTGLEALVKANRECAVKAGVSTESHDEALRFLSSKIATPLPRPWQW